MTKRIFLIIWFCVSAIFCTFAQELTVRSMSHRQTDLSARRSARKDMNGEPCALLRVEFPLEDVVFDGNIVGGVERHVNEYWVYLTAGSKWLEIRHSKFYTLEVLFSDYAIPSLEGLQTYKLVVQASLNAGQEIKTINVIKDVKVNLENGHEYVDLGLPSGTLWATCNVGAKKPEDYGYYFAWGETSTKGTYAWSTYKYYKVSSHMATKYKTGNYGTADNKSVLDANDDVAHVNWGGHWRMPTKAEQDELRDPNNCTWTWTTQKGVKGYEVTSKKNNNTLFLPAAGYFRDSKLLLAGSYGYYWSSSLKIGEDFAFVLNLSSSIVDSNNSFRYYGQSVRPVCSPSE